MPEPTVMETARLRLRPLVSEDLEPLWAIWSEGPVRDYLITVPRTIDDFKHMFEEMSAQSEAGTLWAVTDLESTAVLGRCGFYLYGDGQPPELAILLTQTSWGAGLATEAVGACLRHGFEDLGWEQVVALVRPGNLRVRRVLDKFGFSPGQTLEVRGEPALWLGVNAAEWVDLPRRDST